MIIKKNTSADDIEDIIREIQDNVPPTLRIPNSINFKGIGVDMGVAQAVVTWCRKQRDTELHTYFSDKDLNSESHLKFITSILGITSASLVAKISLENHEEVDRFDFLKPASQMIIDMDEGNFQGLQRGAEIKLISISGSSRRFLKSVFACPRKVKKPAYLEGTIREILRVIIPPSGDAKGVNNVIGGFIPEISWMVFELFQNICDHAEKDEYGVVYPRTIGVLKLAIQKFKDIDSANRAIPSRCGSYLSTVFRGNDNVRFIEVSILDNGPGLARRWAGLPFSDMTIDQEINAVIQCLGKGKTTKDKDGHGYGLNNVMEKLKKMNGLFRIRTGRLSVVKTFNSGGATSVIKENFSGEMPAVEGTLISLLIPVKKES